MGVARMLLPWRASLQGVFGQLHGHQLNALATASWAMLAAQHCQLSRLAVVTPGRASAPSSERRWQRLVANDRLDPYALAPDWARWVLADAGALTLLLDETPQANHLRAMKLSRQTRGRAIPLLWRAYRPGASDPSLDKLVPALLEEAATLLPPGAAPTLLTDRGLSWPCVLDFRVAHHWHYLMRVQGSTRCRIDGAPERALTSLTPRRGDTWCGEARVFKKAKWRRTRVVATWPTDSDEPWFLITDLPANLCRCAQYRKRMRQEQSFRDEKSQGFQWNQSHIRQPLHAARLLLIMALAMTWAIRLGMSLIQRGWRGELERRDRRTLSVFQLGLRYLHRHLIYRRPPPLGKCVGR
jgi:Transposase DDE domain